MSRRLLIKVTEIIYIYCKVTLTTSPYMCPPIQHVTTVMLQCRHIFPGRTFGSWYHLLGPSALLMIRISMILSTLGQACMYVLLGTFEKPKDLILVGSHICLLTLKLFPRGTWDVHSTNYETEILKWCISQNLIQERAYMDMYVHRSHFQPITICSTYIWWIGACDIFFSKSEFQ